MSDAEPQWLTWARRLQALAQNGLTFTTNHFERERYEEIRGIAAEMMAAYGNYDPQPILDLFAREQGYTTPKIDARGVVFKDNQILLVKENVDGMWTLPGGWIDINESPATAVAREVYEESGYSVKPVKLLALYDKHKHPHPPEMFHAYKTFFLCEILNYEPLTNLETSDPTFFSEDNLPPLSLPRVLPSQIHRMFEHLRHPNWPTDFD